MNKKESDNDEELSEAAKAKAEKLLDSKVDQPKKQSTANSKKTSATDKSSAKIKATLIELQM